MNTVEELIFCFVVVELFRRTTRPEAISPIIAEEVVQWPPELEPGDPYFELEEADAEAALRRCEREKLVIGYHSDFARSRYLPQREAIDKFYRLNFSERGTAVHQIAVLGADWLAESLRNIKAGSGTNSATNTGVPASDRTVTLDHNARDVREVLVTLDDAIRELDGINDREAIDNETLQHIFELKAGRAYLEAPQVDLSIIEATVVHGLRSLAARTLNNSVDMAINAALAAVLLFFFGITL